jgi:hypothetical protein
MLKYLGIEVNAHKTVVNSKEKIELFTLISILLSKNHLEHIPISHISRL